MSDSRASSLRALLVASSAAGMLVTAPATASDLTPDDGVVVTADQQQAANLGTIDVNGQLKKNTPKSPEFVAPLVDTPRSITIIPQSIIEQTGATSLQEILRTSPGITFGAGEGGVPLADRPFIRGQSSGNNIFLDGIRDSGSQQREVFNLEQVEVIKGPDAVYSGRGSGGGSINLGSKAPRHGDFTAVSLGVGTDNYVRGTIDQNWDLGETAALRINLMGNQGDVARRGPVDYDKWGVAIALAAGLGTDTTATASYYHLDSSQLPDYGIPTFAILPTTVPRANASGILDVPYSAYYGLKSRDFLNINVDAFTFEFEHRFNENLSIRNVSRFSDTLNEYLVTHPRGTTTAQLINGEYWTKRANSSRWNSVKTLANVTDLTGRLYTGAFKHDFNLGLEFTKERNLSAGFSAFGTTTSACPAGFVIPTNTAAQMGSGNCTRVFAPDANDPWTGIVNRGPVSSNETNTVGVAGFDSITLTEKLLVNLGVRWDRYATRGITKNATQSAGVWTLNPLIATTGSALSAGVVPVAETVWEFVNYQVGVVYKPTSNTSVYASWSTASTPPTIAAGNQNAAGGMGQGNLATVVLDPEDSENFEIGAKANLFGDRLALSAAAYDLTRRNAAILVDTNVYAQAGEVKVRGIELGVSGNITTAWQVFGGYSWMDSELVRGGGSVSNGKFVPNAFEGQPLSNAPEHSASLFTTYRLTQPLSIGGGVYYVGKSFSGAQGGAGGGSTALFSPAYTRVDLFASYEVSSRATVQLNVQNATDEDYVLRYGSGHADVAPGRSATLALNMRF